ncbi:MAG: hypothetical protein CL596_06065 [Alteromonas sp.]|nr:hypothetical protein [Alteromonas sp.]MAY23344.1 hypothetical protein [Flavobacteriaceae bacterium]|tara:strand:+ start:49910 stop:50596 length:687 start_codon:yes stop_codon:yes gene_type:complete
MRSIAFFPLLLFILVGCKEITKETTEKPSQEVAEKTRTTPEAIAHHYGLEYWDQVNSIAFTFNVDRGENHYERSYTWEPKTGKVTYKTATDTLTYNHKNPKDSLEIKADQAFINDKYWLLAPFQLVWDEGISYTEEDKATAPISKELLHKLTIRYGDEGGYTPGDAYDFYYNDDFLIKEWTFRKGNQEDPSLATTWMENKDFNDIKLATKHQDSTGNFQLYFTNLHIE